MEVEIRELPVSTDYGETVVIRLFLPATKEPEHCLFWHSAMGVASRHYEKFAMALAARGLAVALVDYRGQGHSGIRAARGVDYGYREILEEDWPRQYLAIQAALPDAKLLIGGHSLGGQLASLFAARHSNEFEGLVLVGCGSPHFATFGFFKGALFLFSFLFFRVVARIWGYYPGRKLGFGRNEGRRLIFDWSRCGLTGRFHVGGSEFAWESAMSESRAALFAIRFDNDWYVAPRSLNALIGKMPLTRVQTAILNDGHFQKQGADHFGWIKEPAPVVLRLIDWVNSL